MEHSVWPLFAGIDFARGRLFETADLDEARVLCGRVLNPHALQVVGRQQRLRARMEHFPVGPLSLNRLTWGAAVAVDPDRLDSYYLLSLPLKGTAQFHLDGQVTTVSPQAMAVVSAAQRFHFTASADYEQIVVRIERSAIEAGWLALNGSPVAAPLNFACALPRHDTAWQALAPTVRLLACCARQDTDLQSLRFLHARLEEMLVTTLLLHQPHSLRSTTRAPHTDTRFKRTASVHLQQAETFMREHLETPLTLSTVARHCRISTRTLQAAFQQARGMGPMQWWREQRLWAVREVLLGPPAAPGTTPAKVTDTALRFGFVHLGEFAKAYRQLFGEAPSQTLTRGGLAD